MFNKILILVTLCVYCYGNGPIFRNDYKYIAEANGWLKMHLGPMNWDEARSMCNYEGAVLASPLNDQLRTSIEKFLRDQKMNSDVWYSGISALFTKSFYQSIEGIDAEEMSIRWAKGEPAIGDGCVVFYTSDGTMASKDCEKTYPFVCYKENQNTQMVRNQCGTFDDGYRRVTGSTKCYKYHTEAMTWGEAYKVCYAEGAQLAIDYSINLTEFSEKSTAAVYVGYRLIEDVWYDILGNLMKPYTTGNSVRSCGARTWDNRFTNDDCSNSHPFLCEKIADKIV